jgi:iron complex outermembrane receptor protein
MNTLRSRTYVNSPVSRQKPLARLIRRALSGAVAAAPIALLPFAAYAQQSENETRQMESVVVTGAKTDADAPYMNGGVARRGSLGVLGSADVMDTPFSTTNYTAQMLQDVQARTLADVVVNDASVRLMTSTGGFSEDFQIRGFNVTSGDVGFNGLYGLTSSNRMPAALMERVEVLKGPGTLVYGISPSGGVGGNINIVTKKAGDKPLTRVTATYESQAIFGGHLDVGRRFGDNGEWGVRFNGTYRKGDTTLDDGQMEFGLLALALDYRSSKLRWSLDTYAQREDTDTFRAQTGFRPGITRIPKAPSGHRALYPGAELTIRDATVASRVEYDLNSNVMLYAAAGYRYGASEQDFPSVRGVDAIDANGNMRISNAWYDAASHNKTGQVGARFNFTTAGIKHVASVSASSLETEAGSFYLTAPAGTATISNIYHPRPLPVMSGERRATTLTSRTELSSFAVTDTVSLLDERLLITAGARHQTVDAKNLNPAGAVTGRYDESAVAPLAGVVFKPMDHVSVYGNFTSGLSRGSTAPDTAANRGEVFPPYKSKQYEAGVKVEQGKMMNTVSVFQVDRPNALTDPFTNIYSLDGKQRNRGLELSTMGEVVRDVRIMASATFYDATLQRSAGGVNEGKDAIGVPKRTLNLGVDWSLPWVPGLSVNARGIYTAETPFDVANTLTLPSWNRIDIGARYRTEMMGKPVVLRASVENVTNKAYWLSSSTLATVGTVAAPRTVLLSAQLDF